MVAMDPRKMALQIAGLRANETHLPEDERVFQDPYAERFFPEDIRRMVRDVDWVKTERQKYEAILPGVNGAIVARIRYIDECLAAAVAAGCRQVVIIGAGYDTRAYRIDGVKEKTRVFEVDHPLTQAVKTETIGSIFGRLPPHVVYVPMTFGKERLGETLLNAGYENGRRTLFIAEGLLMYIPAAAVDALLAFIVAGGVAGSDLVADFFDPSVIDGTSPLKEARMLKRFVEDEGAPLAFGIPEKRVDDFFLSRGFTSVAHVTPAWCKARYFPAASRQRPVSPMFNFVLATV